MINESFAKKCCCEDISLIENYQQAVDDQTKTWDCHHKKGMQFSRSELKAMGLYFNRPASELVFMPHEEHTALHKKGKHLTDEQKEKQSKSLKGKCKSPETKAKMHKPKSAEARAHMRKPKSAEHRANIGKSKTGAKHPNARAVYQIDIDTGEIIKKWMCIREAAQALNIKHKQFISFCCNGKKKSVGGFKWQYAD